MEKFPRLETHRLVLDQIITADIPDIVAYAGNKKITDNTRTMPHPYFAEDAISWINMANQGFRNKDNYIFAIRDKANNSFMGGIGLTLETAHNRAEIGYWIAEQFWNMGYTSEAVTAMLKFGFQELQLNKIVAAYISTNVASGKIMVKNGMVKEGEFKDHDIKNGEYVTLIHYGLLKKDFES
ncbi:GNAT family N-acetyltransferase [Aggregatimonas sangjinii]|uniref:GNAT family N-acetyltransferase n=1 Tax=Aggregatimonas sangjinii TaxID=2583587 RepID=A0A5B7SU00_9FLAO|nr:GNAT family protein [Aggregatimonas sangjinii]QCX00194.1 GNAT family N-acetyltransferase [Aggregatimonas sangjinii]